METEFGAWLKGNIRRRHMTIVETASMLGLTRETVYRHLNGLVIPHRSTLMKYAEFFGVNYSDLYEMTINDRILNGSY